MKIPAPRQRLADRLARARGRFAHEQWFIGLREAQEGERLPQGRPVFRELLPPPGRLWADPFPIEWRGRRLVFFEDLTYGVDRGVISYFEIEAGGAINGPHLALERPYHLSYPFVFLDGDDLLMIPETAQNGTIELYRAVESPERFELQQVLIEGVRAADPTLWHQDEHYWIFANTLSRRTRWYEDLSVFSAPRLTGPWDAHARNPVVSDFGSARPGGRMFRLGDDLIRPAQDCAPRYGHDLVFNRVDVLSREEFSETEIGRAPRWTLGNRGTHTYNRGAGLEVIDGRRMMPISPGLNAAARAGWQLWARGRA